MSLRCKEIIKIIEKIAPSHLAYKHDNVGLLIGDEEAFVSSVLISLDVNDDVIEEAIDNGTNLIITHHPVIFTPLKSINVKYFKEKMIYKIISKGINVFSVHTNLDASQTGINDYLAKKLKLTNSSILQKTFDDKLFKITVYVPEGYEKVVRDAMVKSGAGYTGNYSGCTFNIKGKGTFMPLEGSMPYIGRIGHTEYVNEIKIETISTSDMLPIVIEEMLKAHPYEEPAYDIFPLANNIRQYGLGRIGYLDSPLTLIELCKEVKTQLGIEYLNVTGELKKEIRKVAVCSGSGADFIESAYNAKCDAYITGDIKFHNACDARDMGLALIDAGHFATENIYMKELCSFLKSQITPQNYNVDIVLSNKNKSPFVIV